MKKGLTILLCIMMIGIITVSLSSCAASFPTKERVAALTNEDAAELLKGKTEEEIHAHWGDPDNILSGFYGDVYESSDKSLFIYYDPDGTVENVRVFDQ